MRQTGCPRNRAARQWRSIRQRRLDRGDCFFVRFVSGQRRQMRRDPFHERVAVSRRFNEILHIGRKRELAESLQQPAVSVGELHCGAVLDGVVNRRDERGALLGLPAGLRRRSPSSSRLSPTTLWRPRQQASHGETADRRHLRTEPPHFFSQRRPELEVGLARDR